MRRRKKKKMMTTLMILKIFEAYRRSNVSDGGFQGASATFPPAFERHLKYCLLEKKTWGLVPKAAHICYGFVRGMFCEDLCKIQRPLYVRRFLY